MSRRLSVGVVTAIVLHGFLLVTLTIGAPIFFNLNADAPEPQAGEPAPLEVSMVEIPDEAPPVVKQAPAPPPPPPAPAVVPIPAPAVPPAPAPVETPQPVLAQPPVIEPVPPRALPVLRAVPVALLVENGNANVPEAPTAVDAGPSDYLYAPKPSYPYEARQNREEGTVLLRVTIDDGGVPVSVTIDKSSGFSILDNVAQKGVETFRFRVGDNRVFRVPITFEEEK
jgi:protein TonB